MCFLPKSDEIVKVRRCDPQDVLHVIPLCIAGSHCIAAIRLRHFSGRPQAEFNDHLGLRVEPVNMAWLVVLGVRNKANAIEP